MQSTLSWSRAHGCRIFRTAVFQRKDMRVLGVHVAQRIGEFGQVVDIPAARPLGALDLTRHLRERRSPPEMRSCRSERCRRHRRQFSRPRVSGALQRVRNRSSRGGARWSNTCDSTRYATPAHVSCSDCTSVTTLPGASGIPRWSWEPCQNLRAHPDSVAGCRSSQGKSASPNERAVTEYPRRRVHDRIRRSGNRACPSIRPSSNVCRASRWAAGGVRPGSRRLWGTCNGRCSPSHRR